MIEYQKKPASLSSLSVLFCDFSPPEVTTDLLTLLSWHVSWDSSWGKTSLLALSVTACALDLVLSTSLVILGTSLLISADAWLTSSLLILNTAAFLPVFGVLSVSVLHRYVNNFV